MTPFDLAAHLLGLEQSLMQRATRRSAEKLKSLIHADFQEIGASGRTYNLADLIATLAAESDGPAATISNFTVQSLSPNIALVTYRTDLTGAARLRSSIWRREGGTWKLMFHQGTPAA